MTGKQTVRISLLSIATVLVLICAGVLTRCGEIDRSIGYGYRLYETNSGTITLYRDGPSGIEIMVAALVRQYAVLSEDPYIVGQVIESQYSELRDEQCPGWFIVFMESGDVECGLSQDAWRKRLIELGIDPDGIRLKTVRSKNLIWN